MKLPPPPVGAPTRAQATPEREVSGAMLLAADVRTGLILINAARYRMCARLFGLPAEQVNIATLVAVAALAEAMHDKVGRLLHASPPTPGDVALGATVLRHAMLGPDAPGAPQAPVFGALVFFAMTATVAGPTVIKSVRGVKNATLGIGSAFARRYGHRARRGRLVAAADRAG